jgi:hypothetical protein
LAAFASAAMATAAASKMVMTFFISILPPFKNRARGARQTPRERKK